MAEFSPALAACPLFDGIDGVGAGPVLTCLGARTVRVDKGAPLFLQGDPAGRMGIVLDGALQSVQDDYYGNRSVLSVLRPGDAFGEAYACAGLETLPVSVVALKESSVLLLDGRRVIRACPRACGVHTRIIANLMRELANKNLALSEKIRLMSRKTTREKLLAYLSAEARRQGGAEFTIPLGRQALADYLGVERSAMSAELSRLRRDGLLETKASWFRLRRTC